MKRHVIVGICFCYVILSACTDDLYPQNDLVPERTPAEPTQEELYKEIQHSLQTDKQIMLYSLIRYEKGQGKFILDLSLSDAESLDISLEAYREAEKAVEKMNEHR